MSFRARARRSLSEKNYIGETITGDFRNGFAERCGFKHMTFVECQMDRMSFFHSGFFSCTFTRCSLNQTNFNAATLQEVEFHDCSLDQASFRSATIDTVSIVGGRAEYSVFEDAGAKDLLLDTQLHGADIRFAGASNVDYGTSNLWGSTVKLGCKQFVGARLNQRTIEILIGLIAKTKGNDEIREKLRSIIGETSGALIDRLTLTEV